MLKVFSTVGRCIGVSGHDMMCLLSRCVFFLYFGIGCIVVVVVMCDGAAPGTDMLVWDIHVAMHAP